MLAPYAMHDADSRGRAHPEQPHPYRSPYQRDRDRIVHCSAFRRLSHKTQVFTGELGDYHRSRLTHTMEVTSVARTVARALGANEDLAEALALGHDIGHPPFGHAGEDVLDERLKDHGGFNHNAQAVRIFELLEQRYVEFPGLNLSYEVLQGQRHRAEKQNADGCNPILEVQIVDAADSIAYDAHDADDALELGMIEPGELRELAIWDAAAASIEQRYTQLEPEQFRRAVIHELLDRQVGDLLKITKRMLAEYAPASPRDVQESPAVVVASPEVREQKRELERFLFERVYRHPRVLTHRREATAALEGLYDHAITQPDVIPACYRKLASSEFPHRAAADYLSSITDRYALEAARGL